MSQLTRYGFSREAGRRHIPVPLVRRPAGRLCVLPGPTSCMANLGTAYPVAWPHEDTEIPTGESMHADSASGLEGSAAEATSGAPAGRGHFPANADQSRTGSRAKAGDEAAGTEHASACPAVEPVSRPAAGRSAAATSEPMDVTAGETAPASDPVPSTPDLPQDDDGAGVARRCPSPSPAGDIRTVAEVRQARAEAISDDLRDGAEAEFAEALQRVQRRHESYVREIRKAPAVDYARLAAAARSRSLAPRAEAKAPTRHAQSADPCDRCGVPGFRGCAHQLPYEAYVPAESRQDVERHAGLRGNGQRKGQRTWRI